VLDEVELLVRGGDDEVLALDLGVLAGLPAVGADHRQRGLAAERRVGQHDGPPPAGIGEQCVLHLDQARATGGPDPVQQQVHRGQPRRAVDQFDAVHETVT